MKATTINMKYTPDGYIRVRFLNGRYKDIPKAKLPMKSIERIHILGAGSLGLFWAAKIKAYVMRYPITMIMPKQLQSESKLMEIPDTGCVTVRLLDHFESDPYVPAAYLPYETATKKIREPIQNLVIATKAQDAIPAVREVYHRVTRNTKVLILSSGSHGIAEELSEMLFKFRIHRVIVADHRVETIETDLDDLFYRIEHVRNGKFYLPDYIEMATVFDEGCLNWCNHGDDDDAQNNFQSNNNKQKNDDEQNGPKPLDFEKVAWYRLALQCVIDPVTAIHGIRNGQLRHLPNFESGYKIPILQEMATLYAAQYAKDVNGNENHVDTMVKEMTTLVDTTIRNTRDFQSDMLRDVLRGRPTEIDYLSGYVQKVAKRHNMHVPVNESLWRQVKALNRTQAERTAALSSSSSSSSSAFSSLSSATVARKLRNPFKNI